VLEIELDVAEQFGARPIGRMLGRAAEALGGEKEVEPWRLCDEEVVIDLGGESLWVAGVRVALTDMPWRFVEFLARRGGKVATTKEIGQYLSRSEYPDVAARRTKADVERRVREKLQAAGVDADVALRLIVADGKRGYRFGVSVRVV
jgi:DNA-binding response OmpR family regulator